MGRRSRDLPGHVPPRCKACSGPKFCRVGQEEIASLFLKGKSVQRVEEEVSDVWVRYGRPGSHPTCCLPWHRVARGTSPKCRTLGRCSGHDHFYPLCSVSQKPQEVPGQLPPFLNSFESQGPHVSLESSPANLTRKHCKQAASYLCSHGVRGLAVFASAVRESAFRSDSVVLTLSC